MIHKCLFEEMYIQGNLKKCLFFSIVCLSKKEGYGIHDQRLQRKLGQVVSETLREAADQRNQLISERRDEILNVTLCTVMIQWEHRWQDQWRYVHLWTYGEGRPRSGYNIRGRQRSSSCTGRFFSSKPHSVLIHSIVITPVSATVRTAYTTACNISSYLWKICWFRWFDWSPRLFTSVLRVHDLWCNIPSHLLEICWFRCPAASDIVSEVPCHWSHWTRWSWLQSFHQSVIEYRKTYNIRSHLSKICWFHWSWFLYRLFSKDSLFKR